MPVVQIQRDLYVPMYLVAVKLFSSEESYLTKELLMSAWSVHILDFQSLANLFFGFDRGRHMYVWHIGFFIYSESYSKQNISPLECMSA